MRALSQGRLFAKELLSEEKATRLCLERIPLALSSWKPHERSMELGYLALLVADIPRWIIYIVERGEIDLANLGRFHPESSEALVTYFLENHAGALRALEDVSDEALQESFSLFRNGQLLYSSSKQENVMSSINHLVHHRGQLTVYMRLNDIAVPAIYGPSADDRAF